MLPSVHTALVHDSRKKSGDSADMARIINRLPFNDTGDSSVYTDNYACQVTVSTVQWYRCYPGKPSFARSASNSLMRALTLLQAEHSTWEPNGGSDSLTNSAIGLFAGCCA